MLRRVRKTEEVARNGADVVVDDDGFVDVVVKWVFGFRHFVVSETVDVSFQPEGLSGIGWAMDPVVSFLVSSFGRFNVNSIGQSDWVSW